MSDAVTYKYEPPHEDSMRLRLFVAESNRIEGIVSSPTIGEMRAHSDFLGLSEVGVPELECFVADVAARPLRRAVGQDVRVGSHYPPPGGPAIEEQLEFLLARANERLDSPYRTHVEYEALHPFMDGNGRSGRVLWAWMMLRDGQDPFSLSFLHRFYYQALDGGRAS
jgi:hypothetical protein